jgi:diadenosine tetraphosphate (Ap4A) HIT family hydrolase
VIDCFTCRANLDDHLAPGGPIYQSDGWRLEHSCEPIPMIGWLILKPIRHIESLAELDENEAAAMGLLARRVSQAMARVLNCPRTYLGLFAEGEHTRHLHLHIVPRFEDLHVYHRGPAIFERLRLALATGLNLGDAAEAVRVSAALRAELASPPT